MVFWGNKHSGYGFKEGIIVTTFDYHTSCDISQLIYTSADEILYPVPRQLYTVGAYEQLSKSEYNKRTSPINEGVLVEFQVNPKSNIVNYMELCGSIAGNRPRGRLVDGVVVKMGEGKESRFWATSNVVGGFSGYVDKMIDVDPDKMLPDRPYFCKLRITINKELYKCAAKGICSIVQYQNMGFVTLRPFHKLMLAEVNTGKAVDDNGIVAMALASANNGQNSKPCENIVVMVDRPITPDNSDDEEPAKPAGGVNSRTTTAMGKTTTNNNRGQTEEEESEEEDLKEEKEVGDEGLESVHCNDFSNPITHWLSAEAFEEVRNLMAEERKKNRTRPH